MPIALPRSPSGKSATMIASDAGVSSAPKTPCSARAFNARGNRAQRRSQTEPCNAEAGHPFLAEHIPERPADQDQPTLRNRGPDVAADEEKRSGDVDRGDAYAHAGDAVERFATAYAEQNDADYAAFTEAADEQRIDVERGV